MLPEADVSQVTSQELPVKEDNELLTLELDLRLVELGQQFESERRRRRHGRCQSR